MLFDGVDPSDGALLQQVQGPTVLQLVDAINMLSQNVRSLSTDIALLREEMVTKKDIATMIAEMATKKDIATMKAEIETELRGGVGRS